MAAVRHRKSSLLISAQGTRQADVKGQENPGQASGDRLHFPGVHGPGDWSRMVQQSDVRCHDNVGQASGDRLHFTTGNSKVTQPEASAWSARKRASSSAGRDKSQNPSARATGDRMQSTLKEYDNVVSLLSREGKLIPKLVTVGGREPQENFRNIRFDELPIQHCIFAHHCMWASFQVSRIVETHTRGFQNSSFHKYAGQSEHPDWEYSGISNAKNRSSCTTEEHVQEKPLNIEWITRRADWTHAHYTSACMSSPTQFFRTGPRALDPICACKFLRKAGSDSHESCKNSNEIAGHSVDIDCSVCLGDSSVQILHELEFSKTDRFREHV